MSTHVLGCECEYESKEWKMVAEWDPFRDETSSLEEVTMASMGGRDVMTFAVGPRRRMEEENTNNKRQTMRRVDHRVQRRRGKVCEAFGEADMTHGQPPESAGP